MSRFRGDSSVAAFGGRERYPGVEGLRAVAAVSILILHTYFEGSRTGPPEFGHILTAHFNDLSYGVTLFFSLSGFLLYRPFAAALLRGASCPPFLPYLRNRALRILPAYWVVLLLSGLLVGGMLSRRGSDLVSGDLTNPGLLLRAALFVQNYSPHTFLTGIGPAWSLAVEVVFYLALPLLVLLAFRLGGRSPSSRVAAALAPAGLLLVLGLLGKATAAYVVPGDNVAAGWNADWHSVIEKSFLGQADLFSFGMALAVLHSLWADGRIRLPRHWPPVALGVAALAYLAAARASWREMQLSYSPYNTLMALACALILGLVVFGTSRSPLVGVLGSRPLVWLGTVSYSIFLWHHPVIGSLRDHGLSFDGRLGLLLNLSVTLLLTVILSALTYRLVEAPAMALKRGSPRTVEVSPVPRTTP